jgi:hypothetical protein
MVLPVSAGICEPLIFEELSVLCSFCIKVAPDSVRNKIQNEGGEKRERAFAPQKYNN